MAAELFLSYRRSDHDRVFPLVERLQNAGVSVWVDQHDIEGATHWSQDIVEAIEACTALVLMVSEAAVASEHVVREVALALDESKHILPLYLEPVTLPSTLRYPLAGIQHIELFRGDPEEQFAAILRSLERLGVTVTRPAEREGSSPDIPHNLPVPLTSFVGRDEEMSEVKELLATSRLLTLVGSGGCGKTRLALQVAGDLLERFPAGVWFVDLAALTEPMFVAQSVMSVLELREEPARPHVTTLIEFLRSRKLLLVLDNCEHLVEACAQLAQELLRVCPDLRILATSREVLRLTMETVWHVPNLSAPDPERLRLSAEDPAAAAARHPAVQLFVERATTASRSLELTPENALLVADVCHRLDGIPLALELAAARVKMLSLTQIAARLDDRFRLLTGGSRTALPRHQTLRATIDWSYDLLSEPEQTLLRRLSVFAKGWTLEAAEAICACRAGYRVQGTGYGEHPVAQSDTLTPAPCTLYPDEVLDLLSLLVDKSLVAAEERKGEVRYRLLETIREYGWERLQSGTGQARPGREADTGEGSRAPGAERPGPDPGGEVTELRGRHLDWFLGLAEQAEPELESAAQCGWLERLGVEHDNLRAALATAMESGAVDAGLRLGGALWRFWEMRGYLTEGREQLARLLALEGASQRTAARARVLNGAGNLAQIQGDYASACGYHEESLAIKRELDDRPGIAGSLNNLGIVAENQGDYDTARSLYQESLQICRELADPAGIAAALSNLAAVAQYQGDYEAARALGEESLALRRKRGDQWGIAASLNNLGLVTLEQADYDGARALFEESLQIHRALENRQGVALTLGNLGFAAECQADIVTARARYEESLALLRGLGDRQGVAYSLNNLGNVAAGQDEVTLARSLQDESLAIQDDLGDKRGIALSLNSLARLACGQGDSPTSRSLYNRALKLCREMGDRNCIARTLEGLAALAVAPSAPDSASQAGTRPEWAERAARLFGAAEALRHQIRAPHHPCERARYESDVAAVRAALDEVLFASAWAQGRASPLPQVIEDAFAELAQA